MLFNAFLEFCTDVGVTKNLVILFGKLVFCSGFWKTLETKKNHFIAFIIIAYYCKNIIELTHKHLSNSLSHNLKALIQEIATTLSDSLQKKENRPRIK
jgi:hypothetical protein